MPLLKKLSQIYVADEVTSGQGKASDADFTSDNTTANLIAGTQTVNASIVEAVVGATNATVGNLYRFLGASDETVNLTSEDFSVTTRWADLGTPWESTDRILLQGDSSISTDIATIERDNINGSYFSCPSLSGSESTSGSLNSELAISPIIGTEKGQASSHLLLKNALGKYVQGGANVSGTTISEVAVDTGAYDLYRPARIGEAIGRLALRAVHGGSDLNIVDCGGVVVNTASLTLTAGELATLSYDIGGTNFFLREGDTVASTSLGCGGTPFVIKKAVFSLSDGTVIKASDVTITFGNDITDRGFLQDSGVFNKDKVNQDDLKKFKGNESISLYIKLVNSNGNEFHISYPSLQYTAVGGGDDNGILTDDITLRANVDANGNALYIATKI
jgi:hypothetical protein